MVMSPARYALCKLLHEVKDFSLLNKTREKLSVRFCYCLRLPLCKLILNKGE